jgi:hypothetical protein
MNDCWRRHVWGAAATVLVAVCVQIGTAIYWGGKIAARLDAVERRSDIFETRLNRHIEHAN